jgi:hypothetical protein
MNKWVKIKPSYRRCVQAPSPVHVVLLFINRNGENKGTLLVRDTRESTIIELKD